VPAVILIISLDFGGKFDYSVGVNCMEIKLICMENLFQADWLFFKKL